MLHICRTMQQHVSTCEFLVERPLLIFVNTKILLNYKNLCKREPPFTNHLICCKYAANMLQNQILKEAHLLISICHAKKPLYTNFHALIIICSYQLLPYYTNVRKPDCASFYRTPIHYQVMTRFKHGLLVGCHWGRKTNFGIRRQYFSHVSRRVLDDDLWKNWYKSSFRLAGMARQLLPEGSWRKSLFLTNREHFIDKD